jgi:hypothetical protein
MTKEMEKGEKHYLSELKEMINDKPAEPLGKVLANFCQRHGVSMDQCRVYYDKLVEKGEIKKK